MKSGLHGVVFSRKNKHLNLILLALVFADSEKSTEPKNTEAHAMNPKSCHLAANANDNDIDIPSRLLHLQDNINDATAAMEFYLLTMEALAATERINSLTLRQRHGLGVMGGFIVGKSVEHINTLEKIRADLHKECKNP
jgi:hypothetical protein